MITKTIYYANINMLARVYYVCYVYLVNMFSLAFKSMFDFMFLAEDLILRNYTFFI